MKKKSLIIALFIMLLDQIIKILLDNLLNINESIKIINNFFYVTKVFNTGLAPAAIPHVAIPTTTRYFCLSSERIVILFFALSRIFFKSSMDFICAIPPLYNLLTK